MVGLGDLVVVVLIGAGVGGLVVDLALRTAVKQPEREFTPWISSMWLPAVNERGRKGLPR